MRRSFATRLAIFTAVIVVAMSALFAAQRVGQNQSGGQRSARTLLNQTP
jgi:hypothetical protein